MRVFFALCLFLVSFSATAQAGPVEQAVGSYADGRLKNASHLPSSGPGYVLLFPDRDRAYGTVELVQTVQTVAANLAERFPEGERLQVGDLSARRGKFISGHSSHQNGLDVDFVYFRMNHSEQSIGGVYELLTGAGFRIRGFTEEFVIDGKLSQNFDLERNWELFKGLVATGRINRMFVDPVIKQTFCSRMETVSPEELMIETLRRLRPWPKHGDHTHVRLVCPESSIHCTPQAEVAPGSGCEEAFTWDESGLD